MLDQQPHHLLVTVTGGPQQRVPPVSLARGRGLLREPVSRLVIVVLLACLKKQLVFLLLLQLFHDLFLVVIVVTPAGTTSSSQYREQAEKISQQMSGNIKAREIL